MPGTSGTYDVVGIGVSTLDLLMVVDELPGRESVQPARESALEGGGPVATAMVTLARLGARAAMVDKVGDDWRGRLILAEFEREGVSVSHALVGRGRSSSIASVLVRKEDGARSIVYAPGDAGELLPSELPECVISSCRILHMNGRHLEASVAAAKIAKAHGVLVSFDGGAHRFRSELLESIALTDIAIVAREFAFAFSGETAPDSAAAKLMAAGPKLVVITAGGEGCRVYSQEGSFHQPSCELDHVVDTTGAGDAFHGAFLFGLLRGYGLPSCALLASAVAALNTQKLGGRSALPSFAETTAFLSARGITL